VSAVAEGAIVVAALLLAVGGPVVLWWLVESETDDTRVVDRKTAERTARADTRDPPDRRD